MTRPSKSNSMQVWTINLPYGYDEPGYAKAQQAFEQFVVDRAGGFTRIFAQGAWKAPNGKMVQEPINVYSIATSQDIFKRIVLEAQLLYPNKQTIYTVGPDGALIVDNVRGEAHGPADPLIPVWGL